MATCPQGHVSEAEDYCDTCGEPIGAATSNGHSSPVSGGGALDLSGLGAGAGEAEPALCPICGTQAAPGALFCENCGYDFTTGTAPSPLTPAGTPGLPDGGPAAPDPSEPEPAAEPEPSEAAEAGEPGEAADPADPAGPGEVESEPGEAAPAEAEAESAEPAEPAEPGSEPDPTAVEGDTATGATAAPVAAPTAGSGAVSAPTRTWVAEVWVDPEWYAEQRPEDAMPSVAAPAVIALRTTSVLIGRPSRSRGISPDIDCGADAGVSRRHAQLTTDGLRWWVEDLGSANGTYLSPVGSPLPRVPIAVGERVELEEGTRIYLGGWTRMVVREAFPGEA